MPPVDHGPWLLGQGDVPLADWLARMTPTRESGVRSPPGSLFTLPHWDIAAMLVFLNLMSSSKPDQLQGKSNNCQNGRGPFSFVV